MQVYVHLLIRFQPIHNSHSARSEVGVMLRLAARRGPDSQCRQPPREHQVRAAGGLPSRLWSLPALSQRCNHA
eukprot:1160061-Pelagomonas_calceolata.AAC.5